MKTINVIAAALSLGVCVAIVIAVVFSIAKDRKPAPVEVRDLSEYSAVMNIEMDPVCPGRTLEDGSSVRMPPEICALFALVDPPAPSTHERDVATCQARADRCIEGLDRFPDRKPDEPQHCFPDFKVEVGEDTRCMTPRQAAGYFLLKLRGSGQPQATSTIPKASGSVYAVIGARCETEKADGKLTGPMCMSLVELGPSKRTALDYLMAATSGSR